jgi:hypothetical protein
VVYRNITGDSSQFIHVTRIRQHKNPLTDDVTGVGMLDVLPKVIGPVELLTRIALPKLVYISQVTRPDLPVRVGGERTFEGRRAPGTVERFAAVQADVGLARARGVFVKGPLVAR